MSKKRKMMIGVAVLLLVGLSISGVWFWEQTFHCEITEGGGALPGPQPKIVVDSQDNLSVVWLYLNETLEYEVHYMKLNNKGEFLIPEKNIAKHIKTPRFHMMIDSCDKIHIVFYNISGKAWKYMKIDNNGNVLVNLTNLSDVSVILPYPVIQSDDGNIIYVGEDGIVDSYNNIHIVKAGYYEYNYTPKVSYKKLDLNGTELIDTTFPLSNAKITKDKENNIWITGEGYGPSGSGKIYYVKLDTNGTILLNLTQLPTIDFVVMYTVTFDNANNLHMVSHGFVVNNTTTGLQVYYMKIDKDWNVLYSHKKLSDLAAMVPSIVVDSDNNIHIVFETHYHCYPIYYVKLDSNGNNLTGDRKLVETRSS